MIDWMDLEYQALITERYGMRAENQMKYYEGEQLPFGEKAFDELAEKFRALEFMVAAASDPSRDKPASLLDNGSLKSAVCPLAKPPSDNTSQLAIAARAVIDYWFSSFICKEPMDNLVDKLRLALQQQA